MRRARRVALVASAALVAGGAGYVVADRALAPDAAPCPTTAVLGFAERGPTPGPPDATPATPTSVPPQCWPTTWPGLAEPSDPPSSPTPVAEPDQPDEPAGPVVSAGPDTTGVPDGVTLSAADGGIMDEDGLVLDGVHITGDLTLTGAGQVLRNSRVDGHVVVRGSGQVIEDAEVGSLAVSGATQFRASRVDVFGQPGEDGIHVTSGTDPASDILIEDSWIHSPEVDPESHYDGVQVRGVERLTLRGNAIDLGPWERQYNAAIFLEDANGGNHDVVVEGNYLNGGGYSLYLEGDAVTVADNQFGRDAKWGVLYPEHDRFSATDNTWADSGDAVDLP